MRQAKRGDQSVPLLWSIVVPLGFASLIVICGCVHSRSSASNPPPLSPPFDRLRTGSAREKVGGEQQEPVGERAGVNQTGNHPTTQDSENITAGVILFERGEFAAAQQFFEAFVSQHPTNPSGVYFLGRTAFERGQYGQAATWFVQAVQLVSGNAEYHHWLGRAYGRQAQQAGGEAFFLARKVRTHFEKAVELDPDNIEARFDLLEYYLQASIFVSGGLTKAREQAEEIAKRNAEEGRKALQRCEQENAQFLGEEGPPLQHEPAGTDR